MAGRVVRTYGRWGGGSSKNSDDLWQKAVQQDSRMKSPIFSTSSDGSATHSNLSLSPSTDDEVFTKRKSKKPLTKSLKVYLTDCSKENTPPTGRPPRNCKKAKGVTKTTRVKRNTRPAANRSRAHLHSISSDEDPANYDFSDIEKHCLVVSDSPAARGSTHSTEMNKANRRRKSIARRTITTVATSTPTRICLSMEQLKLTSVDTSTDYSTHSPHREQASKFGAQRKLRSQSDSHSSSTDSERNDSKQKCKRSDNENSLPQSRHNLRSQSDNESELNETYDPSGDLFADSIHNSLYVSTRRSKRPRDTKSKSPADNDMFNSDDLFETASDSLDEDHRSPVNPANIEDLELSAIEEDEEMDESKNQSFTSPDKKHKSDVENSDQSLLKDDKTEAEGEASNEESDTSSSEEDESSSEEESSISGEDEHAENQDVSRYMLSEEDDMESSGQSSVYSTPSGGSYQLSKSLATVEEDEEIDSELDDVCHSFRNMLTPVRTRRTKQTIPPRLKLLRQCEQKDYIPFSESIPHRMMKNIKKIGEGVYGEVFRAVNLDGDSVALKVMPIEGDFPVNDEPQKTFEEMLPEIVISKELSALKESCDNQTENYVQVNRVSCVQGKFPRRLLSEWDAYGEAKHSENDRPDVFGDHQLFIVFEFGDGGSDLEHYKFTSAVQSLAVFRQVAWALAVAESAIEFEHRDLHWGNILVRQTKDKFIQFTINGDTHRIESQGVHVTIIDFTLSRLTQEGTTVFSDLSTDETLFQGDADYDYQFEIYRKMKETNGDNWEKFHPRTNIFWLHYLANKLVNKKRYKSTAKSHQEAFTQLQTVEEYLLDFDSALHLVLGSEELQS